MMRLPFQMETDCATPEFASSSQTQMAVVVAVVFGELDVPVHSGDLLQTAFIRCVCCNLNVVFCIWMVCEDYSDLVRRSQCDILMLCMY